MAPSFSGRRRVAKGEWSGCGLGESLVQVGEDIVDMFNAHRKPDELGSNAGGSLLFLVELGMGGGGRVNGEGLGITNVGEV